MKKIIFSILLVSCCWVSAANAAQFYFSPASQQPGRPLLVSVVVAPSDPINAIEGSITFDPAQMELLSLDLSSSIISLWIESPHLTAPGTISFSGIIPGGLNSAVVKTAVLFMPNFRVVQGGKTNLAFQSVHAFLNTPDAAEDTIVAQPLSFVTAPTGDISAQQISLDFYPPEDFQIFIAKDQESFGNNPVAIFSAVDKGSGIDHYEVRERILGLFGTFKAGESPYPLSKWAAWSIIDVKAVDKVGRERLETFAPQRLLYLRIALFILLLIIIGIVVVRLKGWSAIPRKTFFWKK